jgi:hypothetical protein
VVYFLKFVSAKCRLKLNLKVYSYFSIHYFIVFGTTFVLFTLFYTPCHILEECIQTQNTLTGLVTNSGLPSEINTYSGGQEIPTDSLLCSLQPAAGPHLQSVQSSTKFTPYFYNCKIHFHIILSSMRRSSCTWALPFKFPK